MQKLQKILLVALTICPVLAQAAEPKESIFSFDAFGTLGVVHSDEDLADFSGHNLHDGGVGYSNSVAASVDSLIGAQITADINDKLTAVVQVISQRNPSGDYDPHLEWANLRYQLTPEISFRVGRSILPSFLASTYINIDYANHWVRPPIELYGLVPITSRDGVSVNHTLVRGDLMNSLELTVGRKSTKLADGSSISANRSFGIADTLELGDLTIHASYQSATLDLDSYDALISAFTLFGPAGENLAAYYDPDNSKLRFIGLGASYDPGQWFVMAEWGQTKSDSIVGTSSGAYVSGGYRIGRLTPFVTIARASHESFPEGSTLDVSTLPPSLAFLAGSLNDALLSFQATSAPVQDSISVGLRWELSRRVAFSAQLDHSNMKDGSTGNLSNLQPGYKPGGSLNLISASLSFVFP
ncbi:MAG: porin [Gammaproteobacteria bacterium]